jgi:hypothetical protein
MHPSPCQVAKVVRPKKAALAEAMETLAIVQKDLAVKQGELAKVRGKRERGGEIV